MEELDIKLRKLETDLKNIESGDTAKKAPLSYGRAFSACIDLVSGIIVGGIIGWGIDSMFSSRPLFFMICLIIGLAAGFKLIYNTIK